jgi:hypothetical protein
MFDIYCTCLYQQLALVAGITGSNPGGDMSVRLLCLYVVLSCVGRGPCDGLITRPEESCLVSNKIQKPKKIGHPKTSIDVLTRNISDFVFTVCVSYDPRFKYIIFLNR